jgi:hypothetical protein
VQRIGHGNDALLRLVPLGVVVVVGVILYDGPMGAFEAIKNIVRDVASDAVTLVSTWLKTSLI